jgi:hypothetical protein
MSVQLCPSALRRVVLLLITATLVAPGLVQAQAPPRLEAEVARDRAAILAMAGDYRVSFVFDETVILAPGYTRKEPQRSGAFETVVVVEDTPARIALQHLLVSPSGHVTKHWRQDWIYEASSRFEFVADETWAPRPLTPAETAGAWTQCVYEVSDAPRYCGTGRWNHRYGVSTWTSDRTWRPLPRREYTKRSDYNALNVENRHTITPDGWTHEQDNTKTMRAADGTSSTLVREFGFNDYRRIEGHDFSPAHRYWERTAAFWAEVRARWDARLQAGTVHLPGGPEGMPLITALFGLAERAAQGQPVPSADVDAAFASHVRTR